MQLRASDLIESAPL